MPCNASPSTNSSAAPRKSAFALSATKHPWNSRLSKLKETNLTCWSIYAYLGFFPSATEARMGALNRYELNSHVPSDTGNCSKLTSGVEFDVGFIDFFCPILCWDFFVIGKIDSGVAA